MDQETGISKASLLWPYHQLSCEWCTSEEKEFAEKVNEIISEDIFKLITSPSYFNEQMKWQERLDVLMEIGGAVTDEDVIKKNSSLSALPSILDERSLDEQKSILAEKRKKINKLLEQYPVRIDEINRSIEDVTTLNQEQLKEDLKAIQASIDDMEKKLALSKRMQEQIEEAYASARRRSATNYE
ncbi:hypothetical protein ACTWKB_02600 [Bacillus sp. 4A_MP2]